MREIVQDREQLAIENFNMDDIINGADLIMSGDISKIQFKKAKVQEAK